MKASKWFKLMLTALMVLCLSTALVFVASCGDDDDDDDDSAGDDDDGDDDDDDGNNTDPGDTGDLDCEGDVCWISGVITKNFTMTADKQWVLRGGVFVGDDINETVLTVEAGTLVFGESSTNGMLVITRSSKIMAEGTAEAPIVFSSSKNDGERARGDWGGIIINGRAPINNCLTDEETFCESVGEGGTGLFGGTDASDNSGTLRYVRVEFAGRLISPDNELNGIAFQGVGSGTNVEYVQVHMNKDDGIEFFGGACNIKHFVVTGPADDMLDWTDGWQGKAQFGVLQQYADAGDQGIEADNSGEDNTATPRSHPTLSNVTIIGAGGESSDLGALLREGTAGNLSNLIIYGFGEAGLAIDHQETFDIAWSEKGLSGELTLTNSIMYDNAADYLEPAIDGYTPPFTVAEFFETLNSGNSIEDPMIADPNNEASPDFTLGAGSPALSGGSVPSDSFFDDADFIGGVGDTDWTAGWTTSAAN